MRYMHACQRSFVILDKLHNIILHRLKSSFRQKFSSVAQNLFPIQRHKLIVQIVIRHFKYLIEQGEDALVVDEGGAEQPRQAGEFVVVERKGPRLAKERNPIANGSLLVAKDGRVKVGLVPSDDLAEIAFFDGLRSNIYKLIQRSISIELK